MSSPEAVLVPPRLLGNKLLDNVRLLAADLADLVHLDHWRLHRSLGPGLRVEVGLELVLTERLQLRSGLNIIGKAHV